MNEEKQFLSTKELAEYFGCSIPTARNVMKRRDFPAIRIGKNFKVSKDALLKWAEKKRV